jgi:hypothetical protein
VGLKCDFGPGHRGSSGIQSGPASTSFDHLVGAGKDRLRDRQTERFRGPEVACARALQQRHAAKKDGLSQNPDHGNAGECSSGTTRATAHYDRKTCRRQAEFAEPQRSGPCPGNRQNAAGVHRCMQGRASEPCRRSDCPAQARWPHRAHSGGIGSKIGSER